MKRRIPGLLPLVLCLLLCGVSFRVARSLQQPSLTPFTMVQREVSGGTSERHKMIAVRSDGARSEKIVPGGNLYSGMEARILFLPQERKHIVIADAVKKLSTFYLTPQAAASRARQQVSRKCEQEAGPGATLVGEGILMGTPLYQYSRRGSDRIWLAPKLGCQLMESHEDMGHGGSFERTVVTLSLGEPDPELFAVPADYEEVPPSQAEKELIELKTGEPFGSSPSHANVARTMQRADAHYWESQAHRPR